MLLITEVDDLVAKRLRPKLAVPLAEECSRDGDVEVGEAGDERRVDDGEVVAICAEQTGQLRHRRAVSKLKEANMHSSIGKALTDEVHLIQN